jgi:plasmid stabilization system protein ParE
VTKTFKLEITATAEADVTEIWEYIAQDNADTATA